MSASTTPNSPPTEPTSADKKQWHENLGSRPRWVLQLEALAWRKLSDIGFVFHRYAPPSAPPPAFSRSIPITVSPRKQGELVLRFWVPPGYQAPGYQPSETESNTTPPPPPPPAVPINPNKRYPVIINFHGGGFTIGSASDDARWAYATTMLLDCVCVSVEYRLAPEHPFPTAVEDGADACLWLVDHPDEYRIDPSKMVTSGFSAGGNMAFTVCMKTRAEVARRRKALGLVLPKAPEVPKMNDIKPGVVVTEPLPEPDAEAAGVDPEENQDVHVGKIIAVCAFYPSSDFTLSRDERRLSILRKDKGLPAFFTDLFDASYLHPPKSVALDDPYLSPGKASDQVLRDSLPDDIIMYTCEWDELLVEGERFAERLRSPEVGKRVMYRCIMNARHGWDKSPAPWEGKDERRDSVYKEVCGGLGKVIYGPQWSLPGGLPEEAAVLTTEEMIHVGTENDTSSKS